jgi:putative nucleotidyltransferase with HDIG domain
VKRVLFVDDEQNLLDGLRRMLRPQRNAWQMAFAIDGPAALDLLAREPYDVVVSDMRMPGMDGAALLAIVCDRYPAAIRIILSGYTELEASVRAVPVAHQFLQKPCDATVLRRTIEQQMGLVDRFDSRQIGELVGSLRALPSAPRTYQQLRDAVAEPRPSIDRLADVVASDVGISARILHLANSAFFGQRHDVADIKTAVTYLGTDILTQLVLTVEIFRSFQPATPIPGFSIERFQRHCHLTGAIAERLATASVAPHAWVVPGLLHDVGKLVLADRDPVRFGRAQAIAVAEARPAYTVEEELFGHSHAEIGAYLLSLWGLAAPVVEAVANHHHPERAGTDVQQVSAAIYLANRLAHLHDGTSDATGASPTRGALESESINPEMLAVLGGEPMLATWRAMAAEVATGFPVVPPAE